MNPFYESPLFQDLNRKCENGIKVLPAILANQDEGVAVFLGPLKTCLTRDGAMKLALQIADALATTKTEEETE